MKKMDGNFALMLHAHIPYCRKSGTWPAGEEWLFEAMNETYIPLLSVFRRFQQKNLKPHIMFGVVPILAEQLADPYMNDQFCAYMEDKISRAEQDIDRFSHEKKKQAVAQFHKDTFERTYNTYKNDFYRNVVGTLKWLQEEGVIEILTSAATHGFLPLLESDSGIYSQLKVGIQTYEKYFETKPKGIWLPECAYRPRDWSKRYNYERRSIDEWLADEGLSYFFTEDIGITNAEFVDNKHGESHPSTYRGYKLESGVCVFGRNSITGKQVWSPEIGYPGDPYYREFHQKDSQSGLHYWRITGGSHKDIYDPSRAKESVQNQAEHFTSLVLNTLKSKRGEISDCLPLIMSPYDCELYGHWWMEGVDWLEAVYQRFAKMPQIRTISLSTLVEEQQDSFSIIKMQPSTWGKNGDFTVWNNPEHAWLWPYINSSIKDFEEVLKLIIDSKRVYSQRDNRILQQCARELLLMEGSDWPFLLYTKQAKEYANQRFHNHHQRFNKLLWAAKNLDDLNRISDGELHQIEEIDNPWPHLDFNLFREK
ncbi:1,4-alpha-glucan branching protein domain-containing protein [Candidatus Lokiarchaeum ossiferum]|uniref:1,4-alpha-glucan branching protein domain-containing protein n=1 Tax=Candidatus Lokiarchaeum ossiferum TaxID=2951803 RepID=UPI00352CC421